MSTRSFAGAVALVLLAVAAFAVPAAAAPHTWYVAPAGSGGGSCAHPDRHAIQPAIAAAHAGDTILVCDGTYTETLLIKGAAKDGLKVRAVHPGKAYVRPPASGFTGFIPALVQINSADNTRFSGFTLIARGSAPCLPVAGMIQVTGTSTDTTVTNNHLTVGGASAAYNEPCGYGFGISQDGFTDTALIDSNEVDEFGDTGITSNGPSPTITNNVLRFTHSGEGNGFGGDAIHINGSESAVILNNDIESPATAGTTSPVLGEAIRVVDVTGAVVAGNTARFAYNGIVAGSWVGGRIRGNTVRNSVQDGIVLSDSKNVTVRSNSSLGNGGIDCHQSSSHGPNTWTDNTGQTSVPAGLCSPP